MDRDVTIETSRDFLKLDVKSFPSWSNFNSNRVSVMPVGEWRWMRKVRLKSMSTAARIMMFVPMPLSIE